MTLMLAACTPPPATPSSTTVVVEGPRTLPPLALCAVEPRGIREVCLGKYDRHGQPCMVCVGFQGCEWPETLLTEGWYCTGRDGCADGECS